MKKKVVYTTSDGREFEDKVEAAQYEAGLGVRQFLNAALWLTGRMPENEEAADMVIAAILADPSGFNQALEPLLRKPRKKRADAGVPRGKRKKAEPEAQAA